MASNDPPPDRYTYAQAGVSIDAGNALVRAIGPLVKATRRPGADAEIGGFGGFFDPKAAGYSDPLLVAANDGVGTKLKLAIDHDRHDTVGIDLVAMCANDLIVQGAEPLFFLDYFATGKLDNGVAERVIAGIADGCRIAGCALIGGETAEMPGMYAPGDYDLAGFCVGAVERGEQLTGEKVAPGHVLLGLASSGVHSNGYSLVRRLAEDLGWRMDRPALFDPERLLIDTLAEPTRIYVKSLLPVVRAGKIDALAHITGGGLLENIPRVLPEGAHAVVDADAWEQPRLMAFLQGQGNIEPGEMARTFNCGIGMVLAVIPEFAREVAADYDRIGGNAPAQWSEQFDLSKWGLLTASQAGDLVGSVLIAVDTPEVELLEGRGDLALIWDIRVRPTARGQGIGSALMRAAEDWARSRACAELKVETQNINFGACRLYERAGFRLREAIDAAYRDFPEEIQLIWTKRLTEAAA